MQKIWFVAVFIFCAHAWAAEGDRTLQAVPADEAARLVKAGLGESVLLAWVAALEPYAAVSADAMIKLKEAKVPEKVIEALVRRGGSTLRATTEDTVGDRDEIPTARSAREAETRREYTRDDAVRYTYVDRARTRYMDTSVYYSSYSYWPYSYGSYGFPSCYRWSYPQCRDYVYPRCYVPSYFSGYGLSHCSW